MDNFGQSKMSLRNLAIELVNEAKSHTDGKSRLYYLEQLKEILLNRDRHLIKYFRSINLYMTLTLMDNIDILIK